VRRATPANDPNANDALPAIGVTVAVSIVSVTVAVA